MPVDSSFFQRQGWEANHAERTPSRPLAGAVQSAVFPYRRGVQTVVVGNLWDIRTTSCLRERQSAKYNRAANQKIQPMVAGERAVLQEESCSSPLQDFQDE